MEDDELCERRGRGDEQAFRDLFRPHHARMTRVARAFVADRAAAEDIAQETWLAVLTGIGGFARRSSLKSWIYAILANRARTRAARDRRADAFGYWADPPWLRDGLDPERVVAGQELWAHVMRAIEGLSGQQRAVIFLRDVEGQGSTETCSTLGLAEANQRVLLHRARARIRRTVEALVTLRDEPHGEPGTRTRRMQRTATGIRAEPVPAETAGAER